MREFYLAIFKSIMNGKRCNFKLQIGIAQYCYWFWMEFNCKCIIYKDFSTHELKMLYKPKAWLLFAPTKWLLLIAWWLCVLYLVELVNIVKDKIYYLRLRIGRTVAWDNLFITNVQYFSVFFCNRSHSINYSDPCSFVIWIEQ